MAEIRVLVCGGRDYRDVAAVCNELNRLKPQLVITGAAMGADKIAETWAMKNGVPLCTFPAQWWYHGLAAGPIRNKAMLEFARPTMVLAFPGGTGTADMLRQAEAAGVPIQMFHVEHS